MIQLRPAQDLVRSAKFTFDNMKPYYEKYNVDWGVVEIEEQILSLDNWDVFFDNHLVGALRLAFEDGACVLRDVQIDAKYQNKGLGRGVIEQAFTKAKNENCRSISLKVFKISPAVRLYEGLGFAVNEEGDRFLYMSLQLSDS